ncbi:MAG: AtpZ/AtpI family protein [Eubacteriales bacterium]|nr:AtpZ/AtpI family protein [Eubacteriales bacterium]
MRKKDERFPLRMLVLISQLGINMMVSIFLCAWLGSFVARVTGVEFLFVIFLFLGMLAGFRSCYSVITRFVNLKSSDEGYQKREDLTEDEDNREDKWDERDAP